MSTTKHIDTIWGIHELPEVCNMIIKTPMFQRLRNIQVMGPVSWVAPSANHTVYEHSIGTAIFTKLLMNHLASLYDFVTPDDILCATIASLVRSVGAMPWDSTFREFLVEKGADFYLKETFSGNMVFHMFSEGRVLEKLAKHKYLIKALVKNKFGEGNDGGPFDTRYLYMFCIVNSGRYPDATFIDRMLRDASRLGISHSLSVRDIIDCSRINPNNTLEIPDLILTPLLKIREQIDTFVANDVTAAMKVMGKNAWKSSDIMIRATKTHKELMDITDLTFITHPHFAFFHREMSARSLPIMAEEKHFELSNEVSAFIEDHPLEPNHQYHISSVNKRNNRLFILRTFLVL